MPIDFLSKRNQAADATKALVESRNVTPDLSGIMANRGNFLDKVGGQISGMTGLAPSYSQKVPAIDRRLQGLAAKQTFTGTRAKYDSIFQNALDRATQAGMDVQSATAYARELAAQNSQQEFQAGEANKNRVATNKINLLKNQYQDMGTALENSYQPQNDYQGALARVLLGTGTQIGTQYYLNKNLAAKNAAGGLGGGTAFSSLTPYSEGASGRAPQPFTGEADFSGISRPGFSNVRG